ncbi:1,4-alpha-glucan branching protein [Streptomyces sp. NPDC089919]|uniref:maltokinase N-terminal cap-like domain-containing protein n=1 Tax=Streptomyces sp. NPDC089919 TaxID=3155188 RepID=UPI003421072D
MAVIHRTTMTPTKLELLTAWLPGRPWYRGGAAGVPELAKAGGFRLDDPAGEVGIELMVVTDGSGAEPVAYQVPVTYRGAPLAGAEAGLIGTSEHGVLGTRWIYDAAHDPVFVAQALALLDGRATAQDQNESGVPAAGVVVHRPAALPTPTVPPAVTDTPEGTEVALTDHDSLTVLRHLTPHTHPTEHSPEVLAPHTLPDTTPITAQVLTLTRP